MEIAVLGAGTYGSYVINSLIQRYPNAHITLFDVGDKTVKSEKEIGYYSSLKKAMYKGLTDGRYFGFGGASDKWGGQLLTYTENDFKQPDQFMKEVIVLDKKSKDEIKKIAVDGAELLQKLANEVEGNFSFEYSPESFSGTEMDYALEVCNAVLDVWKPTQDNKVIINLPATVENAMPHVFATQI